MKADNRPHQTNTTGERLVKQRIYKIWHDIHTRCYNPNCHHYHNYGGRGITVCEEWNQDNINGFENFRVWALANGYTEEKTIDRIDNDKGYSPNNCRWVDNKTQSRNRRSNVCVIVDGVQYNTLIEAVEALHREEDYGAIKSRLERGWTGDRAFTEPIAEHTKHIIYDGVEYKSIADCCRALNLNINAIQCYKRDHHITYEETIKHYLEGRGA